MCTFSLAFWAPSQTVAPSSAGEVVGPMEAVCIVVFLV